ncbi:hypothetical protein APSETT444_007179 [Aspergillus pseudonomiae]
MSVSNDPFDPEIAKQHATVAASLAMRRSTERSSTDSQRSYDRLGGPGSMAVPQRRHRPSGDSEISDTYLAATLTLSRPSAVNDSEDNNNSQLSPAALPPIREFGGLDGRNSSLPSSYRRLRKSRSMFAGGQRYSHNSQAQAPPVGQAQNQVLSTTSKDDDYPAGNDLNSICADRLTGYNRSQTVRSTRSSESLATSRSRVTSWADSTVANTIVTRKTGEQSHLSIIDEQGDSGPNLSVLTSSNSPRQAFSSSPEPTMPGHSVDSQRLYAALMKRIGQNHAQDTKEEIFLGQFREHRAIPTRASSLYPRSSRQTIRRVASNESFTTPRSYATAPGGTVTPQKRLTMLGSQSALDGDTRSINAPESPTLDSSDSPSIYSRTTSGNSPPTKQHDNGPRLSETADEPGVATIFESQRSAYRSPKRTPGPQIQPRPSADWQQWMQSQMARIEHLTPTKEHYKEDAQIYDDEANMQRQCLSRGGDNDISASRQDDSDHDQLFASREPTTTCKIRTGSNFSRPFSRSPSVRTVVAASKEQGLTTAPPFSIHTSVSPSSDGSSFTVGRIRARLDQHASLPMQSRPINRPWIPESPTPKREARELSRRLALNGKYGESSVKWSQAQDTGPVPFRVSRHRDSTRFNNENIRADTRHGNVNERYPLSQDTGSPMSSKRMVELFLSSRRRQMGMEMSDDSAPDGAFL